MKIISNLLGALLLAAILATPATSYAQLGKLKDKVKAVAGGGSSNEASTEAASAEDFWKVPSETQDVLGTAFFTTGKSLNDYKIDAQTAKEVSQYVYWDAKSDKNIKKDDGTYTRLYILKTSMRGQQGYPYTNDASAYTTVNHDKASYLWGVTTGYSYGNAEDGTPKYPVGIMVFDHFAVVSESFERANGVFKFKSARIVTTKENFKEHFESLSADARLEKINTMAAAYYTTMQGKLGALAAAAEEENRKKYSIKGKDVKSLDVRFAQSTKFFLDQPWRLEIIATLADGTVIDPIMAYASDYDIKVTGAPYDGKSTTIIPPIDLQKMFSEDNITVTVKSKTHPNLKPVTISQNIDYSEGFTFSFNGYNGNSVMNPRRPAGNIRVEVKATKHAASGEPLYEYRVFNNDKFAYTVRMNQNKTCYVNAKGYAGAKPGFGDQNGGAGGTIMIIRDPSAAQAMIVTSVQGGAGHSGYGSGANGTVKEVNQKVSW